MPEKSPAERVAVQEPGTVRADLLVAVGVPEGLEGLAAIAEDEVIITGIDCPYHFDLTAHGRHPPGSRHDHPHRPQLRGALERLDPVPGPKPAVGVDTTGTMTAEEDDEGGYIILSENHRPVGDPLRSPNPIGGGIRGHVSMRMEP